MARELGAGLGDRIKLINPNGARTAFGTTPRINAYEVVYIFTAGRFDIDKVRVYLPFTEAQTYFDRDGLADEIEVMVDDPEKVTNMTASLLQAGGEGTLLWTWRDASGGFLRALDVEDNVMFVIMAVLVLIAAMNIVSGLIMLVKNKGRDIGILRTIGLTEGAVLRVFFICGAFTGLIGTILGVILGCLFAIYIDPLFSFVNYVAGGGGLGSVDPGHLCPARKTTAWRCPVCRRPVVGPVVHRHHLPGPPRRTDEPGRGVAL